MNTFKTNFLASALRDEYQTLRDEYQTLRDKILRTGGCEVKAPTGARIVGNLKLVPAVALFNERADEGFDHITWEDKAEFVTDNRGRLVYGDDDGATWVFDDDGRWQPIQVDWKVSVEVLGSAAPDANDQHELPLSAAE